MKKTTQDQEDKKPSQPEAQTEQKECESKYYVSVELIEEESPLETDVMQRKNYPCVDYEDALAVFKFITRRND